MLPKKPVLSAISFLSRGHAFVLQETHWPGRPAPRHSLAEPSSAKQIGSQPCESAVFLMGSFRPCHPGVSLHLLLYLPHPGSDLL